jgi:hypothetical protein
MHIKNCHYNCNQSPETREDPALETLCIWNISQTVHIIVIISVGSALGYSSSNF